MQAHYPVIAAAPTSHIELKHLLPAKYDALGNTLRVGLVLGFFFKQMLNFFCTSVFLSRIVLWEL